MLCIALCVFVVICLHIQAAKTDKNDTLHFHRIAFHSLTQVNSRVPHGYDYSNLCHFYGYVFVSSRGNLSRMGLTGYILSFFFFFMTVEFVSTSHGFWCSSQCLCRLSYHFCWKRTDCFCGTWSRASIRGRMQFIWTSLLDAVKTSIFGLIRHLQHQNLVFLKIFWTSSCVTWVVAALFFPLSAGAIWALCVTRVSHQRLDQMGSGLGWLTFFFP